MPRTERCAAVFVGALLLAGCAGGGQFVRPTGELTRLGATTEQQVTAAMGQPAEATTLDAKGKQVRRLVYQQGAARLSFEFLEGVLVGHCAFSPSGAGALDPAGIAKARAMQEGRATRKEIEAALGTPSGESIEPLALDPLGRRLTYKYAAGPTGFTEVTFEIDRNATARTIRVVEAPKK